MASNNNPCDSFWRNYENCFKWMRNHEIEYWKSRAISLEYENQMLRAFIERNPSYTCSSDLTLNRDTPGPSRARGERYSEADGNGGKEESQNEFEFVVDEGMIEFLEQSMKHKEDLRKKKMAELTTASPDECRKEGVRSMVCGDEGNGNFVNPSDVNASPLLNEMSKSFKNSKRTQKHRRWKWRRKKKATHGKKKTTSKKSQHEKINEQKGVGWKATGQSKPRRLGVKITANPWQIVEDDDFSSKKLTLSEESEKCKYDLYGKKTQKIMGMETALQLNFHEAVSTNQPVIWPIIELNK